MMKIKRHGFKVILSLTILLMSCLLVNCTQSLLTAKNSTTIALSQSYLPQAVHETNTPAKSDLSPLTSWMFNGAIAVQDKNKSLTASINWQQQGVNNYQIRLFGPLGGGSILINKKNKLVYFNDGKKLLSANNASALLRAQTGIFLPVESLYYWVQGLPAPGKVLSFKRDNDNCLIELNQQGYIVNYADYIKTNNRFLPKQIKLQGHDVVSKLVISSWKLTDKF